MRAYMKGEYREGMASPETNEKYMRIAIGLAEKGAGFVNPNPLVGAVIVKDGEIVGQGYHQEFGRPHAEVNALSSCTAAPEGAALYVTLEPCCHYGKTPPCVDAIIASRIKEVVVGCLDPNPKVAGKGVEALAREGVKVTTGVLEGECRRQNEVFFHYIRTQTPFVVMKYAMTADGKIATSSGASRWVTGAMAREKVHSDRHRYMGIMVGSGTVLADDPFLTCRMDGGKNPVRIICDTSLRTPADSNIARTAKDIRTIIATACDDRDAVAPLLDAGCEIVLVPKKGDHIDLRSLMQDLGSAGIDSILLEGGSTVNFSALESGIVNKVQAYIAPEIFGGINAKTPVGGEGFAEISGCVTLKDSVVTHVGEDILIESEVGYTCSQGS